MESRVLHVPAPYVPYVHSCSKCLMCLFVFTFPICLFLQQFCIPYVHQGRSEGISSVAFEVLIINCEIDFINLFIFNCLTSNINLFIFNCLTSNINLFNFNCLTSNFCFPKNISFANRRERLFMDARP